MTPQEEEMVIGPSLQGRINFAKVILLSAGWHYLDAGKFFFIPAKISGGPEFPIHHAAFIQLQNDLLELYGPSSDLKRAFKLEVNKLPTVLTPEFKTNAETRLALACLILEYAGWRIGEGGTWLPADGGFAASSTAAAIYWQIKIDLESVAPTLTEQLIKTTLAPVGSA